MTTLPRYEFRLPLQFNDRTLVHQEWPDRIQQLDIWLTTYPIEVI